MLAELFATLCAQGSGASREAVWGRAFLASFSKPQSPLRGLPLRAQEQSVQGVATGVRGASLWVLCGQGLC